MQPKSIFELKIKNLFCAEALSGLLRQAENQKLIQGARLCSSAPRISHLLFADDCIIFGRANEKEVGVIGAILKKYEDVSGQQVNLSKSSISFSSGVLEETRNMLAAKLGVSCQGQNGVYLGIPSVVGRSKVEIFQMLVDRTRKKAKDWKRKFLSGAGKTVLIKTVLQSIPSYLMSCFALPNQICQRLNSAAASFFWGQKHEERRIHWKSWKKLCMNKKNGGLGFRDLGRFNQALLAKQVWRIFQNESSVLSRSLKARYFPRSDILLASKAHNPSFAWTSLLVGRDLLIDGIAWRLGDGERIRIGVDAWIPDGSGNFKSAQVPGGKEQMQVCEFLDEGTMHWDLAKVNEVFQERDAWKIMAQMSFDFMMKDRIFWPHNKSNMYTVKSGYALAEEIHRRNEATSSFNDNSRWKWIWALETIPKVNLFMWKCAVNALPTTEALRHRSIDVDPICRRCGEANETLEHALRDCKWVAFLWEVSALRLRPREEDENLPLALWIDEIRTQVPRELHEGFATLAWAIWYSRNMLLFRGVEISHVGCLEIAQRAVYTKKTDRSPTLLKPTSFLCSRPDQVKIWCDAALQENVGMGFGVIIRDRNDNLLGSRFGFFPGTFTAIEAEAKGVLEGMNLCKDRNFMDAIIETDCQALFWKLRKNDTDLSYLGKTLHTIRSVAASFHHHTFSWTPREGNELADNLAKFALCNRLQPQSDEGCPIVLNSLL